MKLERLFNVLVLGGASLGLGACGQQAGGGSGGGGAPGAASGTGGHGGEAAAAGSGGHGGGGAGAAAGSGGGPQCSKLEFPGDPKDLCGCPCCWIRDCNNDEPCCAVFCKGGNNGAGCCGG